MSSRSWRLSGGLMVWCASATLLSACGGGSDVDASTASSQAADESTDAQILALTGRKWTVGRLLEPGNFSDLNDRPVSSHAAGIADSGNVLVTFVKSDGTRNVLYAVRGTPSAGTASPVWSAPKAIDIGAGGAFAPTQINSGWSLGLAVAPGGKAYATWVAQASCTATTYKTLGSCYFLYGAAFDGTNWLSPELIGDTPRSFGAPIPRINDNGDIAVLYEGYVRVGASATSNVAVASRNLGQVGFFKSALGAWSLSTARLLGQHVDLQLDANSNLTLAGSFPLNTTVDNIVAYRGLVGKALGSQVVLDTQATSARFIGLAMAPGGRSFAAWAQPNTSSGTVWASATSAVGNPWVATNTGVAALAPLSYTYRLVGLTNGSAELYLDNPAVVGDTNCARRRWTPALPTWTAQTLPSGCAGWQQGYAVATASNGNQLWLRNTSAWSSFDDALNQIVKPMASAGSSAASDYILGFSNGNASVLGASLGATSVLLSPSGVAAILTRNDFDTLPTATTAGIRRPSSRGNNLWGWYFK